MSAARRRRRKRRNAPPDKRTATTVPIVVDPSVLSTVAPSAQKKLSPGSPGLAKTQTSPAPPQPGLPQSPKQSLQPELAVLIHCRTHPPKGGWCPTQEPKILEDQAAVLDEYQTASARQFVRSDK